MDQPGPNDPATYFKGVFKHILIIIGPVGLYVHTTLGCIHMREGPYNRKTVFQMRCRNLDDYSGPCVYVIMVQLEGKQTKLVPRDSII